MERSRKEVKEYVGAVNKTLETIANNPFLFRISESSINREALITKHNLLIYKVENEKFALDMKPVLRFPAEQTVHG